MNTTRVDSEAVFPFFDPYSTYYWLMRVLGVGGGAEATPLFTAESNLKDKNFKQDKLKQMCKNIYFSWYTLRFSHVD